MIRPFWLLATGTGRCGTGYFAQVMSSVGVKTSHEGVFMPDPYQETIRKLAVRQDPKNEWWGWEGESSWLAAPFLHLPQLRGVTIVHLIRHPKKVIDSQMRINAFVPANNHWRDWQLNWLPKLAELGPLDQAALFYVQWNQQIEPYADYRFHVERDDIYQLISDLTIDYQGKEIFEDTRYNSRAGFQQSDVTLGDINQPYRDQLLEISDRYGYTW